MIITHLTVDVIEEDGSKKCIQMPFEEFVNHVQAKGWSMRKDFKSEYKLKQAELVGLYEFGEFPKKDISELSPETLKSIEQGIQDMKDGNVSEIEL